MSRAPDSRRPPYLRKKQVTGRKSAPVANAPLAGLGLFVRLRHPTARVADISAGMGVAASSSHEAGHGSDLHLALNGRRYATFWSFALLTHTPAEFAAVVEHANHWLRARENFVAEFREFGGVVEYYVLVRSAELLREGLSDELIAACDTLGVTVGVQVTIGRHRPEDESAG